MTTPSTRASARPPAQPGDGFARQGLARRGERRRRFRTRRRWRARPWVAILLPYLGEADATGTDALTEYEVLRRRGLRVTLHAPQFEPVWASLVRPPVDAARAHILIYHHAVYWPEGEEILRRHRGRVRILRYHNVTPPEFFAPYSPVMAADLAEGRAQTARLVRLCTHWTADSHFSLHELLQAGAVPRRATVLPPFHQAEALRAAPADPAPGEVLADAAEGVVLFVGRRAPNKGLHHFVRVAEACRRLHAPVRFVWVGGQHSGLPGYEREITEYIAENGLQNVVLLQDKVPLPVLKGFYEACHVFLCLSEHEGFGVPVLEAQALGKPVVALARAAVTETAGPHAVLISALDYDHIAEVIVELLQDPDRREQLGAAGHANYAARFAGPVLQAQFLRLIRRAWAATGLRRRPVPYPALGTGIRTQRARASMHRAAVSDTSQRCSTSSRARRPRDRASSGCSTTCRINARKWSTLGLAQR